ncbi:hypothetical protein CCAX7_60540 [Capsulimonas corticalis]|uniref:Shedu protein SduA C-terminal domain-containing protein n=1 Tax=Capsulimonas corticalis TaxID=2219043 RepID=A0A9N7L831_9BACT|nr:Shedu immune nuclease family protein [Capsulimonas corticalis]BDI34003.1 hypothetical protein CCAX7_60540 [Capsulimonas corticalis]
MSNKPTYKGMSREAYLDIVNTEWEAFKNNPDFDDERNVQNFLEKYPCLIPCPFGTSGPNNHGPYPFAVITQPVLPSFTKKVPDFMWITSNSDFVHPTLIELESPKKKWFNLDGTPTADFTQAYDQISTWMAWFENPLNKAQFAEYYHLPDYFREKRIMRPNYVLIYGRRDEATRTRELAEKRAMMIRPGEIHMSYDRLGPSLDAMGFICSKVDKDGYVAQYIPPTITPDPWNAPKMSVHRFKDDAVRQSPHFNAQGAVDLIEAFKYWDEEAKKAQGPHMTNSNGITPWPIR